jgi:hypothetical protein
MKKKRETHRKQATTQNNLLFLWDEPLDTTKEKNEHLVHVGEQTG